MVLREEEEMHDTWKRVKNCPDIYLLQPAWEKELKEMAKEEQTLTDQELSIKSTHKDTRRGFTRQIKQFYSSIYCKPWSSIQKNKFGEVDFEWYVSHQN